jgi:hypothetical protein
MKLTGMWCRTCGGKWGGVSDRKIPLGDYVEGKCDGCGEEAHVVPAFKFKITVAAARSAIRERRKANE